MDITKALQILYAEDSPDDAEIVKREIRKSFPETTFKIVDTREEFILALQTFPADLVLSDYSMSSFNGLEALQISLELQPELPVLIVTGSINEETAVECLKAGAADYVLKESLKRLGQSILQVLEQKELKAQRLSAIQLQQESEERFRRLAENAQDMIYRFELFPQRRCVYMSPASLKITGYSPEEYYADPGLGLKHVHPDDHEFLERMLLDDASVRQSLTLRYFRKDGQLIWTEQRNIPIFSDDGQLVAIEGIARDVTDYMQTLGALRESEEKFRTLFYNHTAAKMMVDPESGNILEVNQAAAELYGWPVSQFVNMKITDISTLPAAVVMQHLKGPMVDDYVNRELKHRKADGTVFDVELFISKIIVGGKIFLHSIIHDISSKKTAERRLRLLNRAVEQSPVSMIITDIKGRIEYVNPMFTRITGYDFEEVKGRNPRILKSGHHSAQFYKEIWETILAGNDWVGELRNKKKDGSLYWIDAAISSIYNSQGEMTHFVSVREDITQKKNLIEDLILAKGKAEESDRLKSSFLANMSHEIRTPMNGIIGFLELLKESELDAVVREEYLQVVRGSGDRLMSTLNDIIEISKIEAGHIDLNESVFNVSKMLMYFCDFFRPEAEKKGLSISMGNQLAEKASIKTDKSKLESILVNLIKNALKFTTKGFIEIGVQEEEEAFVFYVKDSGSGIAADQHEIIFDRFTQAEQNLKREYEGSGLGLSICRAYARLLNGRIWLESEVGKGSTFYVSIADGVQSAENKNKRQQVVEPFVDTAEDDALILIAEDDEASYYYLEVVLMRKKYHLLHAVNGADAVEFVKQNPGIQLVLMDIKMPVMDGYEATRQIRQFNQEIPIIAQTAFAMTDDIEKIERSGFNDYVTKPIKIPDLLSAIEKYIYRR